MQSVQRETVMSFFFLQRKVSPQAPAPDAPRRILAADDARDAARRRRFHLSGVRARRQKSEEPVPSLPGVARKSLDLLLHDANNCCGWGFPAMALFSGRAQESKSLDAAAAWHPEGLVPRTVRALKERFPDLGSST